MKKQKEKHITVMEDTFSKLRIISKREDRTMRAVITRLINNEFQKGDTK